MNKSSHIPILMRTLQHAQRLLNRFQRQKIRKTLRALYCDSALEIGFIYLVFVNAFTIKVTSFSDSTLNLNHNPQSSV